MITEKRLILSHNVFWKNLLPMTSQYVRSRNLHLTSFDSALGSYSNVDRGIVNELAFRLFAKSTLMDCDVHSVSNDEIVQEAARAADYIHRFRQFNRSSSPSQGLDHAAIDEARDLAVRLRKFIRLEDPSELHVWPKFAGCGVVDECNGDVLYDTTLCEVKSGAGPFRGRDLRQVLCYAALNFASKSYEIRSICMVNPRNGVYFREPLNALCSELAGLSASEVLSEIVEYMSSPFIQTEAV